MIKTKTAENLMKKAGAERVSKKASIFFAKELGKIGIELSKKAVKNAKIMGRKTIKEEDIKEATKKEEKEGFEI